MEADIELNNVQMYAKFNKQLWILQRFIFVIRWYSDGECARIHANRKRWWNFAYISERVTTSPVNGILFNHFFLDNCFSSATAEYFISPALGIGLNLVSPYYSSTMWLKRATCVDIWLAYNRLHLTLLKLLEFMW